jgi:hypothetical protein
MRPMPLDTGMRFQIKGIMTPFSSEKERLHAALTVVRSLHENPEHAAGFESGTTFVPIGVCPPEGRTADRLERVACAVG